MNYFAARLLCGAAAFGVAAGASMALPSLAIAQSAPVVAKPVVQALPSHSRNQLNTALRKIAQNPRDSVALIEAGDAARALQDFSAAIGFYRRAEELGANNARVQSGLASAYALSGDPVSAIPLFDAAERAGATLAMIASDRGLAYDLVGDNAAAKLHYQAALPVLSGADADEVRTRMAVSEAINGNKDAAYASLLPLLNQQSKPGWRTFAFTLAIAGETTEAVDVAKQILPEQLASNIAPYLRYMPRLTRAQQAAAANLGRFPRASEVGRDDARIAAYAPVRTNLAGSGLIPKGAPLGSSVPAARTGTTLATNTGTTAKASQTTSNASRDRTRVARESIPPIHPRNRAQLVAAGRNERADVAKPTVEPERVAPPEPKPVIEHVSGSGTGELPPIGAARSQIGASAIAVPVNTPAAVPSQPLVQERVTTPPRPEVASAQTTPAPAVSGISPSVAASTPSRPQIQSAAVVQSIPSPAAALPAIPEKVTPAVERSLSEIFADIGRPTAAAMPAPGAVDIRMITPAEPPAPKVEGPSPAEQAAARAKAEADAKATADARAAATARTRADAAKARAAAAAKKKPAAPAHPSRTWVQIGVGRDKDAIMFDWGRNTRSKPALFSGREPFISDMGRTNRVLVGPFASQREAMAFISDARKQGFTDFLPWTSALGQAVNAL